VFIVSIQPDTESGKTKQVGVEITF